MAKPSIFVIILNWNGYKDTASCLESIDKLVVKNYSLEVVVVDNGSTDESIKRLEGNKKISLLKNNENLGFSGGNNVGIKYALDNGADYVCILNNDTELSKTLFEDLILFCKDKPHLGAVSPLMYFYKGFEFHKDRYKTKDLGRVVWYAGGLIDWKNVYGSNANVDEVDNGQLQDTRTDFCTGACMFLDATVLREVGVFDERYFLYLEDTDLSLRIKKAGYETWFASKPHLWHKVSQGSAIGSELNDYFITRNRLLFGLRYANFRAKQALIRESLRFIINGRKWQRRGALDFYLRKFGKGSWGKK